MEQPSQSPELPAEVLGLPDNVVKAFKESVRQATASPRLIRESMEKIKARLPQRAMDPVELADLEAEDLRQRRLRAVDSLASELGPRYSPERVSLAKFRLYHEAQKAVVERMERLAGMMPNWAAEGNGLVLYGAVGTGKDHLLAALLYAAAGAGVSCRWINGQELYGLFRDGMDNGSSEASLMSKLAAPQVLAISDPRPSIGNPTAWNVNAVLYRLIDRRYRDLKATWITINARDPADADEALSAGVFDRVRDGAELIPCFWPSYRERERTELRLRKAE